MNLVGLLLGVLLGVDRVPVVQAAVVKLARRILTRQIEQRPFLECVANCVGGPRHHRQMGEADVAVLHGEPALWHLRDPLPDQDPVGGGVGGHVTVEADPVDPAVATLVLPVLGLFELGRELRKLELQVVDVSTQLDEA